MPAALVDGCTREVEAKVGREIKSEYQTMPTDLIKFYFRMEGKMLSGMTGRRNEIRVPGDSARRR
jgi:preprotein translocase subunit SecA